MSLAVLNISFAAPVNLERCLKYRNNYPIRDNKSHKVDNKPVGQTIDLK